MSLIDTQLDISKFTAARENDYVMLRFLCEDEGEAQYFIDRSTAYRECIDLIADVGAMKGPLWEIGPEPLPTPYQ